jgi:hypothetical protein
MRITLDPLTVFFLAVAARLGWAVAGVVLEQLQHQIDRAFAWIHRHAERPEEGRYIELASFFGDELTQQRKRREG